MDLKDIEKECMERAAEMAKMEQRFVPLEKRVERLENLLIKAVVYTIATLGAAIAFFVKIHIIGGLK